MIIDIYQVNGEKNKNIETTDLNQFEGVFKNLYSPLCNYALKIISDQFVAEEIVQNLFIELWEKDKLAAIQDPERYLLRGIKNKCIDHLRSKKDINIRMEVVPEIETTPFSELQEEDIEPLLHYFAAKLPPKTREVFLMSRKSGLTYKEISEELNISPKTVESQMGRALRNMKELLKKQQFLSFLNF